MNYDNIEGFVAEINYSCDDNKGLESKIIQFVAGHEKFDISFVKRFGQNVTMRLMGEDAESEIWLLVERILNEFLLGNADSMTAFLYSYRSLALFYNSQDSVEYILFDAGSFKDYADAEWKDEDIISETSSQFLTWKNRINENNSQLDYDKLFSKTLIDLGLQVAIS